MSDETMALVLTPGLPDLFGRVTVHIEDEGLTNFMDIANEVAVVQSAMFGRRVEAESPEWQIDVAATFMAAQGVLQAIGTMLGVDKSVIEETITPWMHEDRSDAIAFVEFGQRLAIAQRKWINRTLNNTNLLEEMIREGMPSDEIPDTLPTEGTPPNRDDSTGAR